MVSLGIANAPRAVPIEYSRGGDYAKSLKAIVIHNSNKFPLGALTPKRPRQG